MRTLNIERSVDLGTVAFALPGFCFENAGLALLEYLSNGEAEHIRYVVGTVPGMMGSTIWHAWLEDLNTNEIIDPTVATLEDVEEDVLGAEDYQPVDYFTSEQIASVWTRADATAPALPEDERPRPFIDRLEEAMGKQWDNE